MEQPESNKPLEAVSASANDVPVPGASFRVPTPSLPGPLPCPTCGVSAQLIPPNMTPPAYVYALGRIEPRFPSLSVEKEYAQATGRAETAGLTDRQSLQR